MLSRRAWASTSCLWNYTTRGMATKGDMSMFAAFKKKPLPKPITRPIPPTMIMPEVENTRLAPIGRQRRDEEIRAHFITMVTDTGEVQRNVRLDRALRSFDRDRYFLVEVDPTAKQPVCRLFDKKMLFDKQKASKKKKPAPASVTKELVFGWNVAEHDLGHKLGRAVRFLEKGNKVKIDILLKKGQLRPGADDRERLIKDVTSKLKPYRLSKPAFFVGSNCVLLFENPN